MKDFFKQMKETFFIFIIFFFLYALQVFAFAVYIWMHLIWNDI